MNEDLPRPLVDRIEAIARERPDLLNRTCPTCGQIFAKGVPVKLADVQLYHADCAPDHPVDYFEIAQTMGIRSQRASSTEQKRILNCPYCTNRYTAFERGFLVRDNSGTGRACFKCRSTGAKVLIVFGTLWIVGATAIFFPWALIVLAISGFLVLVTHTRDQQPRGR